jgi:hypothetical protein
MEVKKTNDFNVKKRVCRGSDKWNFRGLSPSHRKGAGRIRALTAKANFSCRPHSTELSRRRLTPRGPAEKPTYFLTGALVVAALCGFAPASAATPALERLAALEAVSRAWADRPASSST